MDINALKEAGLTDGEIKVYLALLELGSSTTGKIVDKSGVARSIVYQLLEKLIKKGLVGHIIKAKTKYYEAAQPQKLLDYVNEREKRLQQNKAAIKQVIPELLLKQQLTSHNEANFYEGIKGVQTAHEKTYERLERGETYYGLGIPAFQPDIMHIYWKRDHLRRIDAGIKVQMLFNAGTEKRIVKNRNSFKWAQARLMPPGIITPAYIEVFKDTTLIILQSPKLLAVEIVNQQVADSFKAYFETFWKATKAFTPLTRP